MSNVFSNANVADNTIEDDFVGGGSVFESDIYEATIKAVYLGQASTSKARSVNFILNIDGKELKQSIWVTNRDGDVTYKDKKSGEARNLPGFTQVNSVCLLVCGKELGHMAVEELTLKLYDFELKKEINKAVDCFSDLHGKTVHVAVQKQVIDKTKKSDGTGKYEPTGETQTINEIVKFFGEEKLVTISEVADYIKSMGTTLDEVIRDGNLLKAIKKMPDENKAYADTWLERHRGQTYNKASGAKVEGRSFESTASSTAAKTNLFDD